MGFESVNDGRRYDYTPLPSFRLFTKIGW